MKINYKKYDDGYIGCFDDDKKPKWGYETLHVSNRVLHYSKNGFKQIDLHHILYFCHMMSLVKYNRPLVKEEFQAWAIGPAVVPLYRELRCNSKVTSIIKDKFKYANDDRLDEESEEIIREVVRFFNENPGARSKEFDDDNGPYNSVYRKRESNPIKNSAIITYYKNNWDLLIKKEN